MLTSSTQKYGPGIGQGELKLKSTTEMGCRFYNCLISHIQLFLVEFNNNFPGGNSQLLFFSFFFRREKGDFENARAEVQSSSMDITSWKNGPYTYIYIYVTILCNNGASIRGMSVCIWSLLSQPKKNKATERFLKKQKQKTNTKKKTVKS
jgi:hypothetical protein